MSDQSRIMLIDDNREWLAALAEYLSGKGLSVLATDDAFRGLALVEPLAVALVVCDYHMPRMDGLQLIRRLRDRGRRIPVVMVSSDDEPAVMRRAIAAGAQDFVPKTSSPRVLLRKVYQALAGIQESALALATWQRLLPGPSPPPQLAYKGRLRKRRPYNDGLPTAD